MQRNERMVVVWEMTEVEEVAVKTALEHYAAVTNEPTIVRMIAGWREGIVEVSRSGPPPRATPPPGATEVVAQMEFEATSHSARAQEAKAIDAMWGLGGTVATAERS